MVDYKELGNWYPEEMLGDIFNFLRKGLVLRISDGALNGKICREV
jgi:hypothetical protein